MYNVEQCRSEADSAASSAATRLSCNHLHSCVSMTRTCHWWKLASLQAHDAHDDRLAGRPTLAAFMGFYTAAMPVADSYIVNDTLSGCTGIGVTSTTDGEHTGACCAHTTRHDSRKENDCGVPCHSRPLDILKPLAHM
jgi:hypothetical protein